MEESNEQGRPDSNMSAPVTVYKEALIAPLKQLVVKESTSIHGLLNTTAILAEEDVSKIGIIAAHAVFDVVKQRLFFILLSNFNPISTRLHNE